mgnify:CR=1 FL=1
MTAVGAASQASDSHNLFYESWNTKAGLPHNTITDITQSEDGYLWLSTWEGIARYNGESFLNSNEIIGANFTDSGAWVITRDSYGNVFIGGAEGQVIKRSSNGEWTELGNVNSQVNALYYHPDLNLLISAENGSIYRVDFDGNFSVFVDSAELDGKSVLSIVHHGPTTFFGTESGLKILHEGVLSKDERMLESRINALALFESKLLAASDEGLSLISISDPSETVVKLSEKPATSILIDRGDRIWLGTYKDGLYLYDNLKLTHHFSLNYGLLDNRILSIFEDRDRSIWVGTNGGLSRLRKSLFTSFGKRDGIDNEYARAVIQRDDTIWVGTSGGLYKSVSGNQFEKVVSDISILSLAIGNNSEVLVGTYASGLYQLRGNDLTRFTHLEDLIPTKEIRTIAVNDYGDLAIGTSNGLLIVSGDQTYLFDENSGLESDFIAVAKFIERTLWIGTSQGFYSIENGELSEQAFEPATGAVQIFDIQKPLNSKYFWIASSRGLTRYDPQINEYKTFNDFGDLPTQKVLSINTDNNGFFWLTTNHGVVQIRIEQVNASIETGIKPNIAWFTERNGMNSRQANGRSTPSSWFDTESDYLWVATAKGISRADLKTTEAVIQSPPAPRFEALYISDVLMDVEDSVQIAAGDSDLKIKFASIDLLLGEQIKYRARLVGYASEWAKRSKLNVIEYFNLPPGNFRFEVQASYDNSTWSDASILEITKLPFWWQTLTARISLYVFIALLILGLFWLKTISAKRVQRSLETRVAERTSELQARSRQLEEANIEKTKLVEELSKKSLMLEELSARDPLTNLFNRRAFEEICSNEESRAQRAASSFCLCFIDIDHFKKINDNWSHNVGDKALVAISKIILSQLRTVDSAARWGGEEFILLLPNVTIESAIICCERIRKAVEQYDCTEIADNLKITISGGVSQYEPDSTIQELIHRADLALYEAKSSGRNIVFPPR